MWTLALLIWPGLPVALGVAFWAVNIIGRITRCKEGELLPTDPLKCVDYWQEECCAQALVWWGLWPWSHWESSWEEAWRHGRPGIGDEAEFGMTLGEEILLFFFRIPLIAPCCSQSSPIRTGILCLIAKLSSSPHPSSMLYGPLASYCKKNNSSILNDYQLVLKFQDSCCSCFGNIPLRFQQCKVLYIPCQLYKQGFLFWGLYAMFLGLSVCMCVHSCRCTH